MKYINMTKDKNVINAVEKILEKKEYDVTCQYFSLFYERLYNDLKLEKFYKLFFGLNI